MIKILHLLVVCLLSIEATAELEERYRIRQTDGIELKLLGENLQGAYSQSYELAVQWELVTTDKILVDVITEIKASECNPMNNENWVKFYAPLSSYQDKLSILKKINGITEAQAIKILNYWPYYQVPATWAAFKTLIKDLEGVVEGIYSSVIGDFESENMWLFGYKTDCHRKVNTEKILKEVEIFRSFAGTEIIHVNLAVEGGFLFNGETDIITMDVVENSIDQHSNLNLNLNNYQNKNEYRLDTINRVEVNHFETIYDVVIQSERKQQRPENNISAKILKSEGGQILLEFELDDLTYDYRDVIAGRLNLRYTLKSDKDCNLCWMAGTRETKELEIDPSQKIITIPTDYNVAEDDEEIFVEFSIGYNGALLFSDTFSSEKEISLKIK